MIGGAVRAPLWSRGMVAVLLAQFLSAMADNALLFGALALLRSETYPVWAAPVLQEFFVGAYILLAPFVGVFADSRPKGRVMLLANLLKLFGAAGMYFGFNPFIAYGLVGAGAAAYSPAKYGILSELTSTEHLVKANGLMESSTIAAILIGAISGGALADWSIPGALMAVLVCYGLATISNLAIPKTKTEKTLVAFNPRIAFNGFSESLKTLLRIPDARFSVVGTGLFWGAGSTLRFLLVAWVPFALAITSNRMPAYLNAIVAVGIVIGAGLAAGLVNLKTINRALPAGVLIGLAVCALAPVTNLYVAGAIMLLIGICGGFFVVPLNALLQDKGHSSVGVGSAIAIQNLIENCMMLVLVGAYTAAVYAKFSIPALASGFGLFLSISMGLLWVYRVSAQRRRSAA